MAGSEKAGEKEEEGKKAGRGSELGAGGAVAERRPCCRVGRCWAEAAAGRSPTHFSIPIRCACANCLGRWRVRLGRVESRTTGSVLGHREGGRCPAAAGQFLSARELDIVAKTKLRSPEPGPQTQVFHPGFPTRLGTQGHAAGTF